MADPITLDRDDYEALRHLALLQAASQGSTARLQKMLQKIELAHGIERYAVWVRWVDAQNSGVYPKEDFPKQWPPQQETYVEVLGRPVARADILAALAAQGAGSPAQIFVTKDPNRLVGWGTFAVQYPG